MKRSVRFVALVVVCLAFFSTAHSQNGAKIGYIDFNTLISAMPGVDSVKIKLQAYQKSLTDQMDAMRGEFENKYQDYQNQSAGMSDLIKKTKEQELQDLQARIDAFQTKAQTDLQEKQQELLNPIIEKAKSAVREIAKENKYTYVLNSIEEVVLYADPADDIMPLVKKKLGIL